MKVVIVTQMDIFGELNYGGVIEAHRHYKLFSSIYGEENVGAIIVTNDLHKKSKNDKVKYIYQKHTVFSVVKNCLSLRVEMDKQVEKNIVTFLKEMNSEIVFFEASFWYGSLKEIDFAKTLVFMHNIERYYAWNRVKHKSIFTFPRFLACSYNESKVVKLADGIICLTERDSRMLKQLYGRSADMILPISFDDTYEMKDMPDNNTNSILNLLFVGSNFPPNLKGIEWFIENVMSKVKNCHLTIIGKHMENSRKNLEKDNVTVVGTVDDTSKYYYDADILVMPILFGDGMKLKTAEAMMYGKNILATDEALVGYAVDNVQGIYRCNTDLEFIKAIEQIQANRELIKFRVQVRELFLRKYETKQLLKDFSRYIEEVQS